MLLPARKAARNLSSASGVLRLLRRPRGVRGVRDGVVMGFALEGLADRHRDALWRPERVEPAVFSYEGVPASWRIRAAIAGFLRISRACCITFSVFVPRRIVSKFCCGVGFGTEGASEF